MFRKVSLLEEEEEEAGEEGNCGETERADEMEEMCMDGETPPNSAPWADNSVKGSSNKLLIANQS